ncbi:hypothetical protein C923_05899 [Plasmodium falciparum UGT5.1]|uniref:Uncharacterized protein n=1 Tax=Plasmodium falciparum UGT5.1 TaxID=1237627 RepID=W7JFB6_PLAFA|nr:hypothetical protein C923_05899 [Plasmodium falciparum UGT5.1]
MYVLYTFNNYFSTHLYIICNTKNEFFFNFSFICYIHILK